MLGPIVARTRQRAKYMMNSTAVVTRVTRGSFDAAVGDYTETQQELYNGICRIKSSWDFVEKQAGDAEQRVNRPALVIPYETDTSDWRPGDAVAVSGDGGGNYTLVGNQRIDSQQSFKAWLIEGVESDI